MNFEVKVFLWYKNLLDYLLNMLSNVSHMPMITAIFWNHKGRAYILPGAMIDSGNSKINEIPPLALRANYKLIKINILYMLIQVSI